MLGYSFFWTVNWAVSLAFLALFFSFSADLATCFSAYLTNRFIKLKLHQQCKIKSVSRHVSAERKKKICFLGFIYFFINGQWWPLSTSSPLSARRTLAAGSSRKDAKVLYWQQRLDGFYLLCPQPPVWLWGTILITTCRLSGRFRRHRGISWCSGCRTPGATTGNVFKRLF